ncbi:MAG: hypothetical protein QNK37_14935 [Acidobacteriota bacterium]|nr:hypothetical protein [Acidobacteriota bacterium]
MIWTFLLLLTTPQFQKAHTIDDTFSTASGDMLTGPYRAIYWNGDVFIADKTEHKMFVLRKDGTFESFGKKGSGPGEFVNYPMNLFVKQNLLLVEEWNRWRQYYFEASGKYAKGGKIDRRVERFNDVGVYSLLGSKAIEKGYKYRIEESGCHFCALETRDWEGVHLSRTFLLEAPGDQLVTIKRSGVVEVFRKDCTRVSRMYVPLENFKLDLSENKFNTMISNAKSKGGPRKMAFDNGLPITSATLADLENLWLLVKNENNPDQRTLFHINITAGKVLNRVELDAIFLNVNYHQGYLAMAAPQETLVVTYKVGK